jgi:hypothetical protein
VCWWLPRGRHARLCLCLCVDVHEAVATRVKGCVVCNKRAPGESVARRRRRRMQENLQHVHGIAQRAEDDAALAPPPETTATPMDTACRAAGPWEGGREGRGKGGRHPREPRRQRRGWGRRRDQGQKLFR